MPLALIAQNLGLPLGAALNKAYGPRVTSLIGVGLYVAGVYISSYMTRLAPFMLFYSLFAGLGVGATYTTPMIAGWTWFPKSKGVRPRASLSNSKALQSRQKRRRQVAKNVAS